MTPPGPLARAVFAVAASGPPTKHDRQGRGSTGGDKGRPPRHPTRDWGTVVDWLPGLAGISRLGGDTPNDARDGGRLIVGPAATHNKSGEVPGRQDQSDSDDNGNECPEAESFEQRVTEPAGVAMTRCQHARPGPVGLVTKQAHRRPGPLVGSVTSSRCHFSDVQGTAQPEFLGQRMDGAMRRPCGVGRSARCWRRRRGGVRGEEPDTIPAPVSGIDRAAEPQA